MTRYAPTLLIGLGGSGIKVLRWMRQQQTRGGTPAADLLAYRGIDFDLDSNSGSSDALEHGEFFYFDPSSIADCVGNLRAELRTPAGQTARRPFREIAEWYPDPEGEFIRYAQAEAVGARQWRPLGRIGFFLNDVEIVHALKGGLADLEARCTTIGELRPPSICIVTSVAGGTGSGILLDVAANLRKLRPDIAIRVILLLPEFFEQSEFASKVLANAYATLLEVANFKNQEERFWARYPRLGPIDERQQGSLFQRVYLAGPYIGQRRPFSDPDRAYAHIADLLLVFLTKELRANAGSYQINDDVDGNSDAAALAGDAGARQVFCGFAAAAIPLLTYKDLAIRWAAAFVEHWPDSQRRSDIFASVETPPSLDAVRQLDDFISANLADETADRYLTSERFVEVLDSYIAAYQPADKKWSKDSLKQFTRDLAEFSGVGAAGTPRFLQEPIEDFTTTFKQKVEGLLAAHLLTPFAVLRELRKLTERIGKDSSAEVTPAVQELEEFHEWLGGAIDGFLAHPLLPLRIQRLTEWLRAWQKKNGLTLGRKWFASAVRTAALQIVNEVIERLDASWSGGDDFVAALRAATACVIPSNQRQVGRLGADHLQALPADQILANEMNRVDRDLRRMGDLGKKLLGTLQKRIADGHRTRDHQKAAKDLVSDITQTLEFELQPGSRTSSGTSGQFRYLSPDTTYDADAIRRAVLSASTHLFRPGRLDNALRKRTARLLVPESFEDCSGVTSRLSDLCKGLLGASVANVTADGDENRILILVEDLYHAAEELAGIYDYYNDYSRRNRALFHIRADIPAKFSDLITVLDRPGPRLCGNSGCRHDIAGTPRTEVLCPGCGAPIRNRCGNQCRMDDFIERRDRAAAIERNTCPACEQPLRTYWWLCTRHGRVPADVTECAACRREHRIAPQRAPYAGRTFVCPGCLERAIDPPFRAAGALATLLRKGARSGVAGPDPPLVQLAAVPANCPRCGVDLAPQCPGSGPAHLLNKQEGWWRCDVHPSLEFYECGVCEYPVGSSEYFCRRCLSALDDCRFCTSARHIRPLRTAGGCCSRCKLPLKRPFMKPVPDQQDLSALFCSNIYGCGVGADLFGSVYPPQTPSCVVCEQREPSLLEVRTRSMHVDACTFCRTLFAESDGHPPRSAATAGAGACCLCGQAFSETVALSVAPNSFAAALRIARALLASRDDAQTFGILFDALPPNDRGRVPSHIRDFASRIRRPAVRYIALPRLERLLSHFDRQFGCRASAGPAATPPPVNCGDSAEPVVAAPEAEETIEHVLSSERVSALRTNADFESWVVVVVRLGIDYDRFNAALGTSGAPSADPTLQDLRDDARDLYRRMTGNTD